jgi:hypothetical protein
MKSIYLGLFFLTLSVYSHSQILGNILGEATRKINRKVEEKIVQAVADEIVRRAFRPIEKSIDTLLRQQFEDSLQNQDEIDINQWSAAYADYLTQMNTSVELPPAYSFNLIQKVEMTDNNDKSYVTLYYSDTGNVFGMETHEKSDERQIVVLDLEKEAAIMYLIDKNGEKTGQVVPNFFKLASAFSQSAQTDLAESDEMKIEATGKTRNVAGYICQEFKGESSEENITLYLTEDFPIQKSQSMDQFLMKFAPDSYKKNNLNRELKGMMLEYENVHKKRTSDKSKWVTQSVKSESFVITNKDFGLDKS